MLDECRNCLYNWFGKVEADKGVIGLYKFVCFARNYVGILCSLEKKSFEKRIRDLKNMNKNQGKRKESQKEIEFLVKSQEALVQYEL